MALSIPNYPDPQDSATPIPAAYGWISEITINYGDRRASLSFLVNRSPNAAATWPEGVRDRPVNTLRISCGDPVPGHPDVTFPELYAVMGDAAASAIERLAALGLTLTPEQSAAVADIATGGSIRKSLYGSVNELVCPDATPVD
jgi:hypothetical protein